MAKKASKKRVNRKLRRTVRKTLAAVFMITALVVAAIPVQDNVMATGVTDPDAPTPPGGGDTPAKELPAVEYEVDVDSQKDYFKVNLDNSAIASLDSAYDIVNVGGTYYLQEIYKVGTFTKGGQVFNTLAAYNKAFMASRTNEVVIPTSVVTSYGEFEYETARDKILAMVLSAEDLQERYNNLFPSNVIRRDPDGDPAKDVYDIDIRNENISDPATLSTNVQRVILDVYVCQEKKVTASGNNDAPCRAQAVSLIQPGTDDKIVYVPFNPTDETFYADKSRTLRAIADDAFGTNAYPGEEDAIQLNKLVLPDSIAYIGNNAFEGCSGIRSFELTGTVMNIGCQAFKGCTSMQSIKINNLQKIGAEAFYNCNSLGAITFPATLDEIGAGAFYSCTSLKTVDMSQVAGGVLIDDFAFYNCTGLNTFDFGTTVTEIGKGCFAVTDNMPIGGAWTKIAFPDSASTLGEAMFDGRINIEEVTLPTAYGATASAARTAKLDDNFFRRCSALKFVTIPGAYASFGVDVFQDVESDQFYVEGPATFRTDSDYTLPENYANPRISAHEAGVTYKFKYGNEEFFDVAYSYQPKDDNGNPVVDAGGNPVKVTDYYLINVATGDLEKYTPDEDNNYSTKIVIKANYNGVSVTGIKEGCFDSVKESATELIVEDGTISSIGESAFKDFAKLRVVHLGNSVTKIGDNAFAGCDALEDVYFNMDKVSIGKEAFAKNVAAAPTGLTFHGKIEAGFEPFDWAMAPDNELSSAGLRVLYMNLPPSNLGTIYDRTSEGDNVSVPLIFYPIYNYLDADNVEYRQTKAEQYNMNYNDYSIIGRVEAGAAGDNSDGNYADAEDIAYVNAAYNVVIPAGVTSIDTPKYYGSSANNTNVTTYVQYTNPGMITNSREAVRYASLTTGSDVSGNSIVPGLFSGWYEDYAPGSADAELYETEVKGNDRVTSITMSTVTSIPDYAFDSCERLQRVDLGAACKEIGTAPFRGCTSLEEVIGNDTIICENDIIYTANGDGTYTLVECLPSRGRNGNSEVSLANDPKLADVSKLSESAFVDCKNVVAVNLTGCTRISSIPKDCFKNCVSLRNVVLPGTVNYIEEGAFKGLTQVHVTIPSKEVYIHREAFEHGNGENGTRPGEKLSTVVIRSYPDSAAFRYTEDNYIGFESYNENEHLVTFLNWDFSELYRTIVGDGQSVRPFLDEQQQPTRSGYKFTGWATITSGATLDVITADTIFIAQFNPNSNGGNGGNGNGNGNGGNGNGNGGNNGDGNNGDGNNGNNGSNTLYTVTVVNGSGSGSYVEGADVIITANNPANGYKFKDWTVDTNNATLANYKNMATSFKMPAGNVKVTANYERSTSGGSVSGNSSNSNNNSNKNNTGTKVVVTRPGISNTDLASATVNGSRDGFIVKISETAEATAAVEQALTNKYGSLDNIRYAAMDISLYDSTGTVKITDTTGYTIDITIPIPDDLREYAGNNRTAAVVNAQLENLTPKFTTIDGVPCVTFRATHFSPYTVYVDTGNLSAGGLDSTPKTGDGIHPKWFLSIGLACLSVVLFMKRDKKAPKVKTA